MSTVAPSSPRTLPRRLACLPLVVLVSILPLLGSVLGLAPAASAQVTPGSAVTVSRATVDGLGVSRPIALTVGKTQDLRGRERVDVSWTGAQRTPNPGVGAIQREFPMVLMQCRGQDTATSTIDRRTCFMNENYRGDSAGATADSRRPAATDPAGGDYPWATQPAGRGCNGRDGTPADPRNGGRLPYIGADGTIYRFCSFPDKNPGTTPADLVPSSPVLREQAQAVSTGADGTGNSRFEVRTREQHASLGCSASVPCSLVAVPVMQLPCNPASEYASACQMGSQAKTSTSDQANTLLTLYEWWQESNWRNRLSVPLTFLATPDQCALADSRPQLNLDGSELMTPALAQWLPAFCLDPASPYRVSFAPGGDGLARSNLADGTINAALTTQPAASPDRPLVNAPVAITGFVVSFVIDDTRKDGSTRELPEVNLTPRLLAKLLTESYSANGGYDTPFPHSHPLIPDNPALMYVDPDFLAVNPAYAAITTKEPLPYPSLVSVDSDVIYELTRYIVADPAARAFLAGTPDQWGMKLNPAFAGVQWPTGRVELRDTSPERKTSGPNESHNCAQEGLPWLTKTVNPLQSLRETALSVLDAKPTQTTVCATPSQAGQPDIVQPRTLQADRRRATMAISSAGDAAQYGLSTAGLQAGTDPSGQARVVGGAPVFVKPTAATMTAALAATVVDPASGTLGIDYGALAANAYPGTMVVNAAVPTRGLDPALAGSYADFLTKAATTLQVRGTAVGQLADGYVPLPAAVAGVTLAAAGQVRAQLGGTVPVTTPPAVPVGQVPVALGADPRSVAQAPGDGGGGVFGGGAAGGGASLGSGGASGGAAAAVAPGDAAATSATGAGATGPGATKGPGTDAGPAAATRAEQSMAGRWALPTLLALGLAAGVLGPLAFLAGQPGNPARRAGTWLLSRVRGT